MLLGAWIISFDPNLPCLSPFIPFIPFIPGEYPLPSDPFQVCWACEHTIASASEKDSVVRLYNFDTEDNYVLQPEAPAESGGVNRIACLASDLRCGLLAAGTTSGSITVRRGTLLMFQPDQWLAFRGDLYVDKIPTVHEWMPLFFPSGVQVHPAREGSRSYDGLLKVLGDTTSIPGGCLLPATYLRG
jgi:hypothetical protein